MLAEARVDGLHPFSLVKEGCGILRNNWQLSSRAYEGVRSFSLRQDYEIINSDEARWHWYIEGDGNKS